MSTVAIPAWTANGVLPPINALQRDSIERSPYGVSLLDYVLRFSGTPDRQAMVQGFLRYRAALHSEGLEHGFQWLDGSFLEDVEVTEGRAPRDIDVVTFYRLPPGVSQQQLAVQAGDLFLSDNLKRLFHVDGYYVHLGMEPERLAKQSIYWYSIWSHRRNDLWKGFVQVDLAPAEDPAAAAALAALIRSSSQS